MPRCFLCPIFYAWQKAKLCSDVGSCWGRPASCQKLEGNMFAFTPWCKIKRKWWLSHCTTLCVVSIILTLNSLSWMKSWLGQVEELVCSWMKHFKLYVIILHLVLSTKSVYNFWPGLMVLAPHATPFHPPSTPSPPKKTLNECDCRCYPT